MVAWYPVGGLCALWACLIVLVGMFHVGCDAKLELHRAYHAAIPCATRGEAESFAGRYRVLACEGMIFRVVRVEGGFEVEQDCTQAYARAVYQRYRV